MQRAQEALRDLNLACDRPDVTLQDCLPLLDVILPAFKMVSNLWLDIGQRTILCKNQRFVIHELYPYVRERCQLPGRESFASNLRSFLMPTPEFRIPLARAFLAMKPDWESSKHVLQTLAKYYSAPIDLPFWGLVRDLLDRRGFFYVKPADASRSSGQFILQQQNSRRACRAACWALLGLRRRRTLRHCMAPELWTEVAQRLWRDYRWFFLADK